MPKVNKINSEEFEYTQRKINQWYFKQTKYFSIITQPFNTTIIFRDLIINMVNDNKKILYVWGKNGDNKELIKSIIKNNKKISYGHIEEGYIDKDITFITYKNINNLVEKYDLIIFDDISTFSMMRKERCRLKIDYLSKYADRIIIYSIEKIVVGSETIEISSIYKNRPFVEPRIIKTRVDLNKDIPYLLYEYMKWFVDSSNVITLYVPSEEKVDLVCEYYKNKIHIKDAKIIPIYKNEDKNIEYSVSKIKEKTIIIVTSCINKSLDELKSENAIVLFADDERYTYKKMLYLCGEYRRFNTKLSEILLVTKDENEEIDKLKKIARGYNKKIWDRKSKIF